MLKAPRDFQKIQLVPRKHLPPPRPSPVGIIRGSRPEVFMCFLQVPMDSPVLALCSFAQVW